MNCHETETWLLRDETPNRPSPEVRVHLRSCAACRQRFARLVRLIQEVQNAPLPAVPAAARARLFAQIEKTPSAIPIAIPLAVPVAGPARRFSPRRLLKTPLTRWAAAAVLCLALGVTIAGIYMLIQPRPDDSGPPVVEIDPDKIEGPVEDRMLARHLLLAETFQPNEQLQTLSDMAADVRRESLAMAGKGTADDLKLLAWLHARLLHDGVLRTARGLDSDSKALVASIVADLRKAEKELDSLAQDLPPPSMNSMRQMRLQVREAAVALEGGPDSPPPAAQPPVIVGSRALLQTLVVSSLQVANEDDPVKRAASSTAVADRLADVLAEQSEQVSTERKDNLTKSLEKVMMRGVHGNLSQVDLKKMDEASRKRMEQIHKKAEDAMQKLKPGLLKFSAEARQHLERFQELTKRIQTHQFQKGKGPPWKKPPPRGGGRSR